MFRAESRRRDLCGGLNIPFVKRGLRKIATDISNVALGENLGRLIPITGSQKSDGPVANAATFLIDFFAASSPLSLEVRLLKPFENRLLRGACCRALMPCRGISAG